MTVQCAWCRTVTGERPPLEDRSVTHSMCKDCAYKQMVSELAAILAGNAPSAALDQLRADFIAAYGKGAWPIAILSAARIDGIEGPMIVYADTAKEQNDGRR